MLGQIAIHGLVAGQRQADAGGDEPVRFLRGVFADDRERDLPGLDVLQSFAAGNRSEEHTSELQSRLHLVCRLLLEKKKTTSNLALLSTSSYVIYLARLKPTLSIAPSNCSIARATMSLCACDVTYHHPSEIPILIDHDAQTHQRISDISLPYIGGVSSVPGHCERL